MCLSFADDPSACIAGIVRIPLLTELRVYDLPYTAVVAGIWINVECNIGIVSACLPVMRPLFNMAPSIPKAVKSKLTGHSHSSKHSEVNKSGLSGKTLGSNAYPDTHDKKGLALPLNAAQMGYQKNMGYHNHWPEPSLHSNETEGSDLEALPRVGNHNSAYGATVPRGREDLEMGIIKGKPLPPTPPASRGG